MNGTVYNFILEFAKTIMQDTSPDNMCDHAYIEYVFKYFLLHRNPHVHFEIVLAMPRMAIHQVASDRGSPAFVILSVRY